MRVTSKGQVTIPKQIRRRHGIRPGSEVEFVGDVAVTFSSGRPRQTADWSDARNSPVYLDRVTGIVDIGMTTDDSWQLLRGE